MKDKPMQALLKKILENRFSEQEHHDFLCWLHSLPPDKQEQVVAELKNYFQYQEDANTNEYDSLLDNLNKRLDELDHEYELPVLFAHEKRRWLYRLIPAAAVLFIVSATALIFFKTTGPTRLPAKNQYIIKSRSIKPGTNKAVLELFTGQIIGLRDAAIGRLALHSDLEVLKVSDGEVIFRRLSVHDKKARLTNCNTLRTPRGGQYKVVLPDGTRVWLNAATTLRFPAVFTGNERRVYLTGEAYFEVAKNRKMPFIVSFQHNEVKVLGTHFNIMNYPDEHASHTTLLEGAVQVRHGAKYRILTPGQQAVVGEQIRVGRVDTAQVVGWKNGNFTFSHEKITTVMNKIARWYDVDVKYQGKITEEDFIGTIPRSKNLEEVLDKLKLTRLLNYKINGRSVIIMR